MSEAEIAAHVVSWLESCGHDVYQEVDVVSGVADIVALAGPGREVWIVEVKRTWSFDLLQQCIDRKRSAQRVFAAVPRSKSIAPDIARDLGIGVILVGSRFSGDNEGHVRLFHMAPRVSSDARHGAGLRRKLRPEHKTAAAAGTPSAAGRHTAFRETCESLRVAALQRPGSTLKELLSTIPHHYSSAAAARSTLAARIRDGIVPSVEMRAGDDGKLRVWAKERAQ